MSDTVRADAGNDDLGKAGVGRRNLLRGAAAVGGALVAGPFAGFVTRAAHAETGDTSALGDSALQELRPVADLRDEKVRLWLPQGFHYRSFHDTEDPVVLDDGTNLPGRHDGMGAFHRRGNIRLVRNHEVNGPGTAFGDPAKAYDPMARGGTTTIEVTPTGNVMHAYTSLNGTQMNCSGGRCRGAAGHVRETINGPDVGRLHRVSTWR
jgi:secreted PhoX family phosphatase